MKKVLVIDDSEVNLFLIKSVFEDDPGVQVYVESNSRKAFAYLKEIRPHVLVLDLLMPYVDGFQLLEEINKEPLVCNVSVLVVSALSDDETKKKALGFGVKDYICKPIQLDEVEEKIRQLL